jgi:hypothetical protein
MAYKVFISYATKDLSIVNQFRHMLTHASDGSVEVYIAEYSALPGVVIGEAIKNAIEACDLFILFWSRHSKVSEWVPQEIGIATQAKKTIMPIVLEPNLDLPGFIKELKYLPAYKDPYYAMGWVRGHVYKNAREKQQKDGLTWLAIGAGVLWLLNRDDDGA